ncbi:hypothetical protein [Paraburkholderia nodosa]|uniref:hypothetical protein n=1 Tax=Paraburkholderia nodosa TaxID=392320 RepID=UPI000480A9E3|nr:hypothetical protein [Paraburkholderia nodosa]
MTSNAGFNLYELGLQYQRSGDVLLDNLSGEKELHLPTCFLYSHAAELFMKAFLALKGVDQKELRQYSHDLVELHRACEARGLTMTITNQRALRYLVSLMRSGHSEYQFRYSERSFNTASTSRMRRDLSSLADAVGAEVAAQRSIRELASRPPAPGTIEIPKIGKIIVGVGL